MISLSSCGDSRPRLSIGLKARFLCIPRVGRTLLSVAFDFDFDFDFGFDFDLDFDLDFAFRIAEPFDYLTQQLL